MVFLSAWSWAKKEVAMNKTVKKLLYWTPRMVTLLFAGFVSIFALDIFGMGLPLGKMMFALAMHLIPTALILLSLLIAWRWEWVGTLLFGALGVTHLVLKGGLLPFSDLFIVAGPCFLLGILFLLSWIFRDEIRTPQRA
jgi:hypothetical protein